MPVKTIVVNGDQDWNFRSLLMCHALDLYRVDSGVFFRDCTLANDATGGTFGMLPNFPEDFSQDAFALETEIREDLRAVFRDDENAVSLAIVLNFTDLTHLSRAGANWEKDPALSAAAKTALGALKSAMALVDQQVDQDGRVARSTTRVWFALLIRDAGESYLHNDLAQRVLEVFSNTTSHIHNVFMLSNGKGQNARASEKVEHFVKLRGIVDVLQQDISSNVRGQVRRSKRSDFGGGMAVAHVRMPASGPRAPEFSAMLRDGLIREMSRLDASRGQAAENERTEDFKAFTVDIKRLLPAAWSENESHEVTARGLDTDVASERKAMLENDDLRSSQLARSDANAIIRSLEGSRFLNKLVMFKRRPNYYARLQTEYEAAFDISRQTYLAVVDRKITQERDKAAADRPALVNRLERMVMPPAADSSETVREFKQSVQNAQTKNAATIKEVTAKTWQLERSEDGGAEERGKAFDVAQLAENNLVGMGAIATILKVFFISLLPVIVLYGVWYFRGVSFFTTWDDVFKAFGVLGYVVSLSAIGAIIAGVATAIMLARKRRIAVKQLASRLQANLDTLSGLAASRLALTLNRIRQSDLQLVAHHINEREPAGKRDVTRDFADLLIQCSGEFPSPNISEGREQRLTETASAAFSAGATDNDKIRGFLARRETPETVDLRVVSMGFGERSTSIPSFTHLHDSDLHLAEPGSD